MATYNLRRFAYPDGLDVIEEALLALMRPHEYCFDSRVFLCVGQPEK